MNILKTLTLTDLEYIEFQLRFILNSLDYNERDFKYLALIAKYGAEARSIILDKKLSTSRASIDNYITKFRKDEVVTGTGSSIQLNEGIKIVRESSNYIFKITLKEDIS